MAAARAAEVTNGWGIRPLAQAGLDEALSLAVGARGVGARSLVLDAVFRQQIAESEAFVGRAVIAHDAFGCDALCCEPRDRAGSEGDGTFLAFISQQLGVAQAGGIIDGHMQELPPQTPPAAASIALSGAIAGDTMADAVDAAELLDVDVDQFARFVALVTDNRRPGIKSRKTPQAAAAQGHPDSGDRPAQTPRNGGAGETLAAEALDLVFGRAGQPGGTVVRPARPIRQTRSAFGRVPVAPLRTVLEVTPKAIAVVVTVQP
jgi:hypothetical protein